MSNKQILNIIGFIAIIGAVMYLIRMLVKKTETSLYSEQAFHDIQDKEKLEKLNKYIEHYHQNGEWEPAIMN